ncbi:MAG: sensor histidine kinase [Ginsengibacter sp.]
MQQLNKLLLRQVQKYVGGIDKVPPCYTEFIKSVSDSYDHYEKDHRLLERSIELSSQEMIELNEQLKNETEQLKTAHHELQATEKIRLEKRLDEEKIKKLHEITEAVIEVQERERAYLAAELHDNINQILATSRLYIDTAINDEKLRLKFMTESKEFIHNAMEEIRALCKSLLPPALSTNSLVSSLNGLVQNIKQVDQIQFITDWENIDEQTIPEKMKLTIFRIIQEQLNNIFKHARATTVIIHLIQDNEGLLLSIKDDGVGFDPSEKRNGVGLQNIINRTNLFNGKVSIDSRAGAGCELVVAFGKPIEVIHQKMVG